MATTKIGRVTISTYMSDTNARSKTNKVASVTYNVLAAAITAYNAAADDAARAATLIGDLLTAFESLTLGVTKSITVGFVYEENLAPPVDTDFAFEFDKFLVSSRDTVNSSAVRTSIPARNNTAIVIESDGTSVSITDPDMSTFRDAYEAVVLSEDNNAVEVLRASISS